MTSSRPIVPAASLLTALVAALAGLLPAVPASAAFPGADGLIYHEQGTDVHAVAPDDTGAQAVTATADPECEPAASPDGRLLTYTSCFGGDLLVHRLDTGEVLYINTASAFDDGDEYGNWGDPTFSPDGSALAATTQFGGSFWRRIAVVDLATGAVSLHTPDGYTVDDLSWSVTGEIIHVVQGDLWSVVPGGTPQQLTTVDSRPGDVHDVDVSPDGSRVAFWTEPTSFDAPQIWTYGVADGSFTHLTEGLDGHLQSPSWSPSGAEIAAHGNVGGQNGLYVMSAQGSAAGVRRLASVPPNAGRPSWSVAAGTGGAPPPPTEEPPGGDPAPGPIGTGPLLDGDPATTERVAQGTPVGAAIEISRRRFADAGGFAQGGQASWVILSRDDDFADSLAGSALAGSGPLLFTASSALTAATGAEIDRVLAPGGTVYVLGGRNAVGDGVVASLQAAGFQVVRLEGPSRVETAIAVAAEVRVVYEDQGTVLLARASGPADNPSAGWADSVSGGALAAWAGVPVLVTGTDSLHPAVADWLAADQPDLVPLLGGTAALSPAVESAVGPAAARVAGADRAETATEIARQLWGVDSSTAGRAFVVVNGSHLQGWAFALAATGISADAGAPLLMVSGVVPPATAQLMGACGAPQVDAVVIGDGSVVPDPVVAELEQLDGGAC
jgi:putative cell wall-binding protein